MLTSDYMTSVPLHQLSFSKSIFNYLTVRCVQKFLIYHNEIKHLHFANVFKNSMSRYDSELYSKTSCQVVY